jgi:hypothetical protein
LEGCGLGTCVGTGVGSAVGRALGSGEGGKVGASVGLGVGIPRLSTCRTKMTQKAMKGAHEAKKKERLK